MCGHDTTNGIDSTMPKKSHDKTIATTHNIMMRSVDNTEEFVRIWIESLHNTPAVTLMVCRGYLVIINSSVVTRTCHDNFPTVLKRSVFLTPLWSWHLFGLDLLADTRWPITRGSIWCSILRIQENFNIQTNHTLAAISCFCLSTFCLGGLTLMHTLCVVDAQVPWTNCVTYFLLSVPVHTHVGTCTHTHTTCQK